jgi:hypothetical protein
LPGIGHLFSASARRRSFLKLPPFDRGSLLEHDPEKWQPVFGKDHAQTKSRRVIDGVVRLDLS